MWRVDNGGNALTSTDPTAASSTWILTSSVDSTNAINAVSCASTELCVAGDSVGNLQSGVGRVLSVTIAGVGSGSVSSLPSGISCPTACSSTFAPGTKVTLSPRPAVGSVFAGWTGGGCSGTATCLVTMSADQSVTATFASENTLTVTDAGTGNGTVEQLPRGDLVSNSLLECLRVQRGRDADCQSGCGVGVCRLERRLHRNQQLRGDDELRSERDGHVQR